MGKKIIMLILVCSLLVLPGCRMARNRRDTGGPTEQPAAKVNEYLPLGEGNTWSYEGVGNEYAQYIEEVAYLEGNRFQTFVDNGGTIQVNVFEVKDDEIRLIYREAEAYEVNNVLNEVPNLDEIVLKTPIKVGTKWEGSESNYEITAVNLDLEVLDRTFKDTIEVTITPKDASLNYVIYKYYSRGIGLVKSNFVATDIGYEVQSLLKEYTVK